MAANRRILQIEKELAALYAANDGAPLPAGQVWRWAKAHPKSALHGEFDWDVRRAAEAHWDAQARSLIAEVTIVPRESIVTRAYVSLAPDRKPGGGYRALVDVLKDPGQRAQLVADALAEYARIGKKYEVLKELAGVRDAVRKAAKSFREAREHTQVIAGP